MDHRRIQPCQQSCQAVTMVNVAMGAVVARHLKVVAADQQKVQKVMVINIVDDEAPRLQRTMYCMVLQ